MAPRPTKTPAAIAIFFLLDISTSLSMPRPGGVGLTLAGVRLRARLSGMETRGARKSVADISLVAVNLAFAHVCPVRPLSSHRNSRHPGPGIVVRPSPG